MRSLLITLFICLGAGLFAQDFTQSHLSTVNGLPDNNVTSVLQDSRGFMWFGTQEGLSRFDGTTFRNYGANKNDTLSLTGLIVDLHEAKPGHLVFFFNHRLIAMNTFTHSLYRPSSFANRYINSIRKANADRYLIGSADTCFVVDADMNVVDMLIPPLKQPNQGAVGFPLTQHLYLVGNALNYFLYDLRSKKLQFFDLGIDSIPPNDRLDFWHYDPKRQWFYFLNYYSGLHRHSQTGARLKSWPFASHSFVFPINDSLLWIGSRIDKRGSKLLNLRNDLSTMLAINEKVSYDAYTMQKDNEGNLWLGSNEGVTKIRFKNRFIKKWHTFGGQPPASFPLNIVKGKDRRMYLSMFTSPNLYRLNEKRSTWELVTKELYTGAWCMNTVGDDIIFTGGQTTKITTYNSITHKLTVSSDFLKPYFPNSDIVILAFQHSNGDRWYSGNKGGGFVRVNAADGKIEHYTKDGPRGGFDWSYYSNYAEDEAGDLYFGVNKSWFPIHWSKKEDRFSVIRYDTLTDARGKAISRGVNKLVTDKLGNLWVGSDGSGLIKYNRKNNSLINYTIEDGLPSNFITNLVFDSRSRLWIATTKGLACLVASENSFRTFTKEEGLADDQFLQGCLYYDSATNELWAGATAAVTAFNVDSMLMKSRQPIKVYVDEILVNSKRYTYEPNGRIQLSPSENNVHFRFVGVHNNGKKIEYSYRLAGLDDEWVESLSNASASYAHLAPGDYVFSVRARYKGDKASFVIAAPLAFTIATPWHKTWWFNTLVLTAGLFSIVLIVRFYYSRKTEKKRIAVEKQQVIEKERTRIATDMHDDFGAGLSRIKFISEKMKLHEELNSALTNDLTKISDYSDEMAEKMNEIVWALNERYDSLDDLISFSRAYAADYLQQHNIQLTFLSEITPNQNTNGEVRRNIFLVIKESLHNIVKHAQATHVEIAFKQTNELTVTIRDNGKGFDHNEIRPFANGIHNMKKRISNIGGHLEIQNERGTVLKIRVSSLG